MPRARGGKRRVRRVDRRSDLRGVVARVVRRPYDGGWPGRRIGLRGDTTRAPSQGPRPKGGRHDAALSFPFGIGTKAANRCRLIKRAVYLISRPRFLHFTLNHYSKEKPAESHSTPSPPPPATDIAALSNPRASGLDQGMPARQH